MIAKHSESLEQHKELTSSTHEIEHLKLVIEKYRRMIFGRKSEKLSGELEQLEFRLEELEDCSSCRRNCAKRQPKQHKLLPLELIRSAGRALRVSLFPKIFRVKWSLIFLRTTASNTMSRRQHKHEHGPRRAEARPLHPGILPTSIPSATS